MSNIITTTTTVPPSPIPIHTIIATTNTTMSNTIIATTTVPPCPIPSPPPPPYHHVQCQCLSPGSVCRTSRPITASQRHKGTASIWGRLTGFLPWTAAVIPHISDYHTRRQGVGAHSIVPGEGTRDLKVLAPTALCRVKVAEPGCSSQSMSMSPGEGGRARMQAVSPCPCPRVKVAEPGCSSQSMSMSPGEGGRARMQQSVHVHVPG
ncbi:hypothetical protein ACOMHN_003667 [Nucella lapillus]